LHVNKNIVPLITSFLRLEDFFLNLSSSKSQLFSPRFCLKKTPM